MKIDFNYQPPESLQNLLNILHKAKAHPRFVGGMVRDILAGRNVSDIDLATSFKPEEIMQTLIRHKIKYVDTGSKFGTITAIIDKKPIEITSLRKDIDCDGRHAKVEFTDDFAADAMRRDFTINAMSYCPFEGELYDYYNGYDDLKKGVVKFIGDPDERIMEDHLRILRFFRFSASFAKKLDKDSLKSCIEHKHLLGSLSIERVKSEWDKMIVLPNIHEIFKVMVKEDIFVEIMESKDWDLALLAKMPPNKNLCYASMFHRIPELKDILLNLRFSNAEIREIVDLASFRNFYGDLSKSKNIKMIFYPLWVGGTILDHYIKISEVVNNPLFLALIKKMQKIPPKFPINGNDIAAFGIRGADIATFLESLKMKWIESDFAMNKGELLDLLKVGSS